MRPAKDHVFQLRSLSVSRSSLDHIVADICTVAYNDENSSSLRKRAYYKSTTGASNGDGKLRCPTTLKSKYLRSHAHTKSRYLRCAPELKTKQIENSLARRAEVRHRARADSLNFLQTICGFCFFLKNHKPLDDARSVYHRFFSSTYLIDETGTVRKIIHDDSDRDSAL
jgi:hypothetical protein